MAITLSTIPPISTFSLPHHHPSKRHSPICLHSPPKFHEVSSKSPVTFKGVRRLHQKIVFRDSAVAPISVSGLSSKLLKMGPHETHSTRRIAMNSSMEEKSGITSSSPKMVFEIMHLVVSLGIILAMDKFLKKAFVAAAIKFPSALFGMFCIFSVLTILDSTVPAMATSLMSFFEPALMFIQRWLPLFYVPSLVVLPLAVKDIPAASGLKICFIIGGGWLASLSVAGYTAIAVRKIVKTEMTDAEPMAKPAPFSSAELWMWSGIFLISFVAALLYPTFLGTSARTCLPFLLASTVLGYMVGSGLPSNVKTIFHPIICCTVFADFAALAFGYLSQSGLDPVLGYYLTKVSSNPGAGDILMGFLGSVILSFAFSMFKQRKLVRRHAAEIFTSVVISTIFSLYSTALIGRLVGLEPALTVSILPRCITVALALSIVSLFKGYLSNMEETMSTIDKDGWLHTGDIVYFEENGYLYVVDRLKEMIKYNGYQIAPADLEAVLISHPEILDAAVTAAMDEDAGEVPVAFVVRKNGSTLSETAIIDFVAGQVAPHKKVRKVVFTQSIPKSPAGKILRRQLRNHLTSRI